jgi:hypothetical protein
MSNIDRIREKLAKLLALGENSAASQGEIDNALTLAAAMMAKHSLTRDDIDMSALDPIARVAYGRHWAFSKGVSLATWELVLNNFVLEFIGTIKVYSMQKMPVRRNGIAETDGKGNVRLACGLAYYGCDEDAACAATMFEELRDAAATMALIRWGGWARGDGAAYAEGFALGIKAANSKAKLALMQGDSQTTALMLVSEKNQLAIRDKANSWLKESHGVDMNKGRKGRSRSFSRSGSNEARAEGRQDGSNYGVTRSASSIKIA